MMTEKLPLIFNFSLKIKLYVALFAKYYQDFIIIFKEKAVFRLTEIKKRIHNILLVYYIFFWYVRHIILIKFHDKSFKRNYFNYVLLLFHSEEVING